MSHKIRASLGLLVLSASLLSCSLKHETELYTVEFYTDYDGIEYDFSKLDKTKATLVGKGYVAVSGSSHAVRLTSLVKDDSGKAIDFENSRQTAEPGHIYTFDSWKGFYSEDNPVSLSNISGDCAVFAYFNDEVETFDVTIANADSNVFFEAKVEYGKTLGEALIDKYGGEEEAKKALKEIAYPLPKYYYQIYEFSGSYKDGKGNARDVDSLFDLVIDADLRLTAVFSDPVSASYKVSFDTDPALTSETVKYGDPVTTIASKDPDTANHKVYTFKGWEGTYGNDAPEGVAGKAVDSKHILYDCTLKPIFEEAPETVKVTFYNADATVNSEKNVSYDSAFGDITAPDTVTGVGTDEAFSGHWSTEKDDLSVAKWVDASTKIITAIELYPVVVKNAIENKTNGKGDAFSYEYSSLWDGYFVSKFVPADSASRSDAVLEASDFPSSDLPSGFALTGISKLGDGSNGFSSSLTKIVCPDSVKYIGPNAFNGHRKVSELSVPGLVEADSFAFSQLQSLTEFTLPSILNSLGSRAFYGCTSLAKIVVKMSEDDFKSKVKYSKEWNNIGDAYASVSYEP